MIEEYPNNPLIREDKAKFYLEIGLFEKSKESYYEAICIYSQNSDDFNL